MTSFLFLKYIEISIWIYFIRLIIDKMFLSVKPIRNFYYDRMIFPSIKVWVKRRYKVLLDEIFALFEVFMINIFYTIAYPSLPFSSLQKPFVFMLFIFTFTVIVKTRFVLTEVNYPKSLFALDISRIIIAYTIQSIILFAFYSPLLNTI